MIYKLKLFSLITALGIVAVLCGGSFAESISRPVDVQITLSEYKIESSLTQFKVGVPYHFIVTNKGEMNHEFVIMPSMGKNTDMSMAQMDKMALGLIEENDLPSGATKTLNLTFKEPAGPGVLEFACHLFGHYEASMKLPITVIK